MNKFVAIFSIPSAAMKDWMASTDEATRKQQSDEMMKGWQKWMGDHKSAIADKGLPLGKTKRVTKGEVDDVVNDLNWYMLVEAESHTEAAELFKNHPHLNIPGAYVDVMNVPSQPM
jgi:hypothetical protein